VLNIGDAGAVGERPACAVARWLVSP